MSDGLSLETNCNLLHKVNVEGINIFGVMKSVCGCLCMYVREKGRGRQTERGKKRGDSGGVGL